MVQLRAGGITAALLIGKPTGAARVVCTVLTGVLITCDRSPEALLSAATDKSMSPDDYLGPGLWAHTADLGPLGTISDHIVVILGTAMMPQLLLRVSASRDVPAARRSLSIAVGLTGLFYLLLITTGFAAAAVVGSGQVGAVDAKGQGAPVLLASEVLPPPLLRPGCAHHPRGLCRLPRHAHGRGQRDLRRRRLHDPRPAGDGRAVPGAGSGSGSRQSCGCPLSRSAP
ncbi:sodium:solute symporter family transporter [Streptomyces eurythermus]|uniref:sodium:solute symporter family transporter n=1 Tax=Streptomyces eurythermus TaxID=42237 RepID=UPI0036FC2A1A